MDKAKNVIPPERPGRGQPGGYQVFLAGTAPRGLDFARRTRRRRGMAGALRLLQSHGRRKTGPPARRPVEIAERRRIVCALERPQPGLRRRSDTAAMQCNDFRPGKTKSGPPLYAASRPTRRKELLGDVLTFSPAGPAEVQTRQTSPDGMRRWCHCRCWRRSFRPASG